MKRSAYLLETPSPTAKLTRDEAVEERLALQVGIVGLEVLLAGSNELDGGELVTICR